MSDEAMNPDFKKRFEEAFMLSGFVKLGEDERETIKVALWALKWGIEEVEKVIWEDGNSVHLIKKIRSIISTEESK